MWRERRVCLSQVKDLNGTNVGWLADWKPEIHVINVIKMFEFVLKWQIKLYMVLRNVAYSFPPRMLPNQLS